MTKKNINPKVYAAFFEGRSGIPDFYVIAENEDCASDDAQDAIEDFFSFDEDSYPAGVRVKVTTISIKNALKLKKDFKVVDYKKFLNRIKK